MNSARNQENLYERAFLFSSERKMEEKVTEANGRELETDELRDSNGSC